MPTRTSRFHLLVLSISIVPTTVVAQNTPRMGVTASSLVTQSYAALTSGTAVTDTTIQGTVNFTSGSDQESGTATLQASGWLQSSVALNLSGGTRQEVQNGTSAQWSGPTGQLTPEALHNSLNWAAWFSPALALSGLAQDTNFTVAYIGAEAYSGEPVQHLQIIRKPAGSGDPSALQLLLQLTTTDLYLDSGSLLPVALKFSIHPDTNALQNIPVLIEFANYQSSGGIQSPLSIRKYLQGTLMLDIAVNSTAFNSGIPSSTFDVH